MTGLGVFMWTVADVIGYGSLALVILAILAMVAAGMLQDAFRGLRRWWRS